MAGTVDAVTSEQLGAWVAALDAVIDELHDDLVRRSIVHLETLRAELLAAFTPFPQQQGAVETG